jgi:hypothetical protein
MNVFTGIVLSLLNTSGLNIFIDFFKKLAFVGLTRLGYFSNFFVN